MLNGKSLEFQKFITIIWQTNEKKKKKSKEKQFNIISV